PARKREAAARTLGSGRVAGGRAAIAVQLVPVVAHFTGVEHPVSAPATRDVDRVRENRDRALGDGREGARVGGDGSGDRYRVSAAGGLDPAGGDRGGGRCDGARRVERRPTVGTPRRGRQRRPRLRDEERAADRANRRGGGEGDRPGPTRVDAGSAAGASGPSSRG